MMLETKLLHASRMTGRSIDWSEDVFVEYHVWVISRGCSCGCCLTTLISFSLCCALQWKEYIFISVYCNTEFVICLQINFAVTKDPVTHCFFKLGLDVSGLGRVIFTRWVPGLTITICNKSSADCGLLFWYYVCYPVRKRGMLISSLFMLFYCKKCICG